MAYRLRTYLTCCTHTLALALALACLPALACYTSTKGHPIIVAGSQLSGTPTAHPSTHRL